VRADGAAAARAAPDRHALTVKPSHDQTPAPAGLQHAT
jgi:hypothetical protein